MLTKILMPLNEDEKNIQNASSINSAKYEE